MKLQINDSGSWRHAFSFNANDEKEVRMRAAKLACIVNEHCKLRILGDDNSVRARSSGPDFDWKEVV